MFRFEVPVFSISHFLDTLLDDLIRRGRVELIPGN